MSFPAPERVFRSPGPPLPDTPTPAAPCVMGHVPGQCRGDAVLPLYSQGPCRPPDSRANHDASFTEQLRDPPLPVTRPSCVGDTHVILALIVN